MLNPRSQHQHGLLDQKGAVIDLFQYNTEVCIPFLLSSRGYGFLWHNPAVGRVELATNLTRWIADATPQLDYWVTAGDTPAAIMERYADATGHAPLLPEWAAGFWQCKLRYRTQEELLSVAREHLRRGLPCPSSSPIFSIGPSKVTGASTLSAGPIHPRWYRSWRRWGSS